MKDAKQIIEEIENTWRGQIVARCNLPKQDMTLYLGNEEYDGILNHHQYGLRLAMQNTIYGIKTIRVDASSHFHLALNGPKKEYSPQLRIAEA